MGEESAAVRDLFGNPWEPPRDPRGRKRHKPSPQGREIVAALKAGGASDEAIALQIGLSMPTLKKYYLRELDHGVSLARNELLRTLYAKGMTGNVSAIRAFLQETKDGAAKDVMRQPRQVKPQGKKEERQAAAQEVGGMYAPGPAPVRPH